MITPSSTPVTDAQATSTPCWRADEMWVPAMLCADMERQVASLRADIAEMRGAAQFASETNARLKDERDEWRLLAEQAQDILPNHHQGWHYDYERLLKLYPMWK